MHGTVALPSSTSQLYQAGLYSSVAIGYIVINLKKNAAVIIYFNNSVYWMDEPRGDILFDIKLRMQ